MSNVRSPSLASVLNTFKAQILADTRVSIPARVERYDSAKQLVDVKPLLKESYRAENGEEIIESLPVITNVPVVFPGAGGFRLTFPVAVGDTVLLVFADRSIDSWLDQGGEASPLDERRHHLKDAIAIPGLHPNNAPWTDAGESVVTIGSDTGALDWVALATSTKNEITALRNTVDALVTAFNGHTHATACAAGTGTTGNPGAATPPTVAVGPAAVGEVKSSTVKIKG